MGALFHARFPPQPLQKHPQGTRDPREWPDEQAAPLRSKNKGSPTPVGSTADSRRQERSIGDGELGLVPEHCLQMAQQLSEQLSGTPMEPIFLTCEYSDLCRSRQPTIPAHCTLGWPASLAGVPVRQAEKNAPFIANPWRCRRARHTAGGHSCVKSMAPLVVSGADDNSSFPSRKDLFIRLDTQVQLQHPDRIPASSCAHGVAQPCSSREGCADQIAGCVGDTKWAAVCAQLRLG